MSGDDPLRQETAQLAAELSRVGPPPPRLHRPPELTSEGGGDVEAEALREEPTNPAVEPVVGERVAAQPTRRQPARRRADQTERRSPPPAAEHTASPVNVTITLTLRAAELLERARSVRVADGDVPRATLREVVLDAVRSATDELRRRHPVTVDPSGAIPRVRVKKRRRLDGYGKKVPVRLYRVEKEALDALADELDVSVSAMVTEALELSYG